MSNALAKPPGKVQAIGIMHLIGGILNIFGALAWAAGGFLNGLMTFGIGCILCIPTFILLPVGIIEVISGAKHLSKDHTGLKPPRGTAIAEICAILGCQWLGVVFGVLTLVFLNDPEVEAYYAEKQLTGF